MHLQKASFFFPCRWCWSLVVVPHEAGTGHGSKQAVLLAMVGSRVKGTKKHGLRESVRSLVVIWYEPGMPNEEDGRNERCQRWWRGLFLPIGLTRVVQERASNTLQPNFKAEKKTSALLVYHPNSRNIFFPRKTFINYRILYREYKCAIIIFVSK